MLTQSIISISDFTRVLVKQFICSQSRGDTQHGGLHHGNVLCLMGAPGTAKDAGVDQAVELIKAFVMPKLFPDVKDFCTGELHAGELDIVGLTGVPKVINVSKETQIGETVFNPTGLIPRWSHGVCKINEYGQGMQTVQNLLADMTRARRMSSLEISKSVLFVLLMNRLSDRSCTHEMPAHAANRLTLCEGDDSGQALGQSWINFALGMPVTTIMSVDEINRDIERELARGHISTYHPKVIAFHKSTKFDHLQCFNADDDETPQATCRSWEMASAWEYALGHEPELLRMMLAGTLGQDRAIAYLEFSNMVDHCISIEEIVADPHGAKIPTGDNAIDLKYTIMISLINRIDDSEYFNHVYPYVNRFDPDVANLFVMLAEDRLAQMYDKKAPGYLDFFKTEAFNQHTLSHGNDFAKMLGKESSNS